MGRQKRDIFKHYCTLDEDPHLFAPAMQPYAPFAKRVHRYLKMSLILSESTARSQVYYPSRASMLKEQRAQFYSKRTQYIIHPFSRVARYRERFVPIVWFCSLAVQPFMGTFFFYLEKQTKIANESVEDLNNVSALNDYFQYFVNGAILIDIFFNFRLGYCVPKFRTVVLDKWLIARHYLSTYFVCDLMCVVEMTIMVLVQSKLHETYRLALFQMIWFRLPRAISMVSYFEDHMRQYGFTDSRISMCKLFLYTVLIIHWSACILILIPTFYLYVGRSIRDSWMYPMHMDSIQFPDEKLEKSMYFAVVLHIMVHFFGMGPNLRTRDYLEMAVLSFILMFGLFYYLLVAAKLLQFFGISNIAEAKYEEFCNTIDEYTVMKKFPPELRARLNLYYEHKFRKKLFWEATILSNLSQHLRFEVILHNCGNLINRVVIFRNLPKSTVGAILANLQAEVYLPNDMVLAHDDINDTIFFITFGTVSCVVFESGREMFHMEDGNHFGNVHSHMRLNGTEPFFDIVAAETTEVYTINRKTVKQCLQNLEEFATLLEDSAVIRMDMYGKMYSKDKQGTKHEDILSELGKKRILHEPNKRQDLDQ